MVIKEKTLEAYLQFGNTVRTFMCDVMSSDRCTNKVSLNYLTRHWFILFGNAFGPSTAHSTQAGRLVEGGVTSRVLLELGWQVRNAGISHG